MATVAAGTRLTPEQLARNALHRRAIEAVIWGMLDRALADLGVVTWPRQVLSAGPGCDRA